MPTGRVRCDAVPWNAPVTLPSFALCKLLSYNAESITPLPNGLLRNGKLVVLAMSAANVVRSAQASAPALLC